MSDEEKPDEEKRGPVCGYSRFPSPGALAAIKKGCICPSQINSMGHGNMELMEKQPGQRWVYHRQCPYHVVPMECPTLGVDGHNDWVILEEPGDK